MVSSSPPPSRAVPPTEQDTTAALGYPRNARRCRTVPERVCQAENGFPRGWLLGCHGRVALGVVDCFLAMVNPVCSVPLLLFWHSSRLSSLRYGKLPSFFASAIAPNTFLREVPLTTTVSGSPCLRFWQMRVYLVRIPHRQGHSIQREVLLASTIAGPGRLHGPTRVGPNGRDLKLRHGNSDRTPGPNLGPSGQGWASR